MRYHGGTFKGDKIYSYKGLKVKNETVWGKLF